MNHCLTLQQQVLMTQLWSRPSIMDWLVWPLWRPINVPYCITLDDLTRSLCLAGLRDLSKRTGKRAVDGLMRQLGPDDPLTLSAMFNLARTLLHADEYFESHDLLTRVLAKREHFFGPEHPDTLMTRNELGMNLCLQKIRLQEAERLVREVLDSRKGILGEEHAYTLWSVNDLSKVLLELRQYDEAIEILEEIIPVVSRTLGDEHVGMLMTKGNLSTAYIRSHQWDKAGDLVKWLRQVVPPDHPDWVVAECGYAYVLFHHENDLEAAEECCKTVFSRVFEHRILETGHVRVLTAARLLLQIYRKQGRDDDIRELKERFPQLQDEEKTPVGEILSTVVTVPHQRIQDDLADIGELKQRFPQREHEEKALMGEIRRGGE